MPPHVLTDEEATRYHADGSVLLRGFFDAEETDLLRRAAKEDHELDRRAFGSGPTARAARCTSCRCVEPPPATARLRHVRPRLRCRVVAAPAEKPARRPKSTDYHSKMVDERLPQGRRARLGLVHQDYRLLVSERRSVLLPLLTSAFIAVDPCSREVAAAFRR